MYFLQATAFGYGNIGQKPRFSLKIFFKILEVLKPKEVLNNRVLTVLTFASETVGRALAQIPDHAKAKNAALKIIKLNKRQSAIDPNDENGLVLSDIKGEIEFKDIQFQYPTRPTHKVLKRFNLSCVTNQTTALCGPSGGGKSTVIALIQRFYDPLSGSVYIDGYDIKT
ncbi:unnamed protein product, partial [Didymodactylos carnosus]